MEVPKNFKDLRKLGLRNIALYSVANMPFPELFSHLHSLLPYYPPCLQERVVRQISTSLRFGAFADSVHDCEGRLLLLLTFLSVFAKDHMSELWVKNRSERDLRITGIN